MGWLQAWLHGVPNKKRPWALLWLGNRVSDARYWIWRAQGGKW